MDNKLQIETFQSVFLKLILQPLSVLTCLMKFPGCFHWTYDIIAAMDYSSWNVFDFICVCKNPVVRFHEASMDKVVAGNKH